MRRERTIVSEEQKSWYRREAAKQIDALHALPDRSVDTAGELEMLSLCRELRFQD